MLMESFLMMLFKAAVTGAVAGAVIALVCLNWERIVSFMQEHTALKESDLDNVGFSLQERLASGDYRTVYGIFNTRDRNVLAAETVDSQRVDNRVASLHRNNPLVVFAD
jgi:hypothetical protein